MTVAFAGLLIFTSCNKEGSVAPDESETFSEASTIAVPATAAGAIAGATTDRCTWSVHAITMKTAIAFDAAGNFVASKAIH